jgi:hypothetical protein
MISRHFEWAPGTEKAKNGHRARERSLGGALFPQFSVEAEQSGFPGGVFGELESCELVSIEVLQTRCTADQFPLEQAR